VNHAIFLGADNVGLIEDLPSLSCPHLISLLPHRWRLKSI